MYSKMKLLASIVLVACLACGLSCLERSLSERIYQDLSSLPDEIRYGSPYSSDRNTVCYVDLGCFSLNGTFKGILRLLPQTPEQIDTKFYLYTRSNHQTRQILDPWDEASLSTGLLDPSLPTFVIIHGLGDRAESTSRTYMKNTLLETGNRNVLLVDWMSGANTMYWVATVNSEVVGRQVALLLRKLCDLRSLDPAQIHIVGFSLGGQIAGFAGKWAIREYGITFGRITALDPSGPFFEDSSPNVHVWREDATFVDVIHTSAGRNALNGELGLMKSVGHADFFPNGGSTPQPGCPPKNLDCSHQRAEALFTESVRGTCPFRSLPCPGGYEDFRKGECQLCGQEGCGAMGMGSLTAGGRGDQFLNTNSKSPFCQQ